MVCHMGLFPLSPENRDAKQEVLGTGLLRTILGLESQGKSIKTQKEGLEV